MGDLVELPGPESRHSQPEPLWREQVGTALREHRREAELRLIDVAERAGVSPQYLSELERGLKDPSSEVLAAIAGALGQRVVDIASHAARLDPRPSHRTSYDGPLCLAA